MGPERILLGLVLTLGTPAAADPSPFHWPQLPVREGTVVDQRVYAHGTPVEISAVKLSGAPDQLLEAYLRAFRAAKLFVLPDAQQPQFSQLPTVTALDPLRHISYSVMFQQNPDGTLTAIQTEAHLAERPVSTAPGTGVPILPGVREPLRSWDEGSEFVSYQAHATPTEVRSFYRQVLSNAGFRPDALEADLYQRGTEQLRLVVSVPAPGTASVVVLRRWGAPAEH